MTARNLLGVSLSSRARRTLVVAATVAMVVGAYGLSLAYDQYSQNGDETNCAACHGDFRATSYQSLKDGTDWSFGGESGLHNVHRRAMLDGSGKCDTCHGGGAGGGNFPVLLGTSAGVPETGPESCSGCHGREADWTGNTAAPTEGWGAGLRQHHWNADAAHPTMDLKVCASCHMDRPGGLTDADPANYTPVGENVNPKFYGLTYGNSDIPDDACNPGPGFQEDYTGGLNLGLDNDGDNIYDTNEAECAAAPTGPGAASALAVQKGASPDRISLSWDVACNATGYKVVYGDLEVISTYGYLGAECGLTTSPYDWLYPSSPTSLYFVLVADNGTVEGSYGTSSDGLERPDDDATSTCSPNLDQDLSGRCD